MKATSERRGKQPQKEEESNLRKRREETSERRGKQPQKEEESDLSKKRKVTAEGT
jgi:hypothetical protein